MRNLLAAIALLLATAADAATEYPPRYRWRTIETEHFLVHFHQGEEELARRAAGIAEEVHARITPLLQYQPRERTHLVLTDHIDVSNGSATPFPHNRMEVYVSAPGADPSSPLEYYDNWLNLVITHEYAHILHLDQARGFPRFVRRVFGRHPLSFPNTFSPLWMTEGLATVVESEATDAGRLKGTFVEMVLRTAALEGRWPSPAQAGGLTARWPGGSARYYFGSAFLAWVARREGAQNLGRYFNEYSGNFLPYRVNATSRDVFGESMNTLWREWSADALREFREDEARITRDGVTTRERVTSLGYETKYPLLSPDGTRLAYAHRGPYERATIRVRDLSANRDAHTLKVNSISSLSWSPDGTAIAFAQLDYVRTFELLSDLYLWQPGRDPRRLTRGARLKDPAFLPDGRALVAVENRAGRNRLVVVDVDSGNIQSLVTPDDETQFSEPAVARDGTIAVAEWKNGRIDVVTYSREGARIANLTAGLPRSTNASPRFTADGATIVFTSDVTGIANVFTVPTRGGTPARISNVVGGAFFPTTLDGRRYYISDYHSEGFDVARFDAGATYPVTPRELPATVINAALPPVSDTPRRELLSPDTPYAPGRSVWPRWWSPIFSTGSVGDERVTTLGATTTGGDVLGFHQYTATATAELSDGETNLEYAAVYSYDRFRPTLTLAALRYDNDVVTFRLPDASLLTYTETTDRLLAQVSTPIRRVNWQLYGWAGVVRDRVSGDVPAPLSPRELARAGVFRGTLQGFRAGALFNNARRFGFSISPENGIIARVDYENLARALGSEATQQQYRADVRAFRSIPFRRSPLGRHVLAARVAAGETRGEFILQRELRVGGTGMGEFLGIESRNFPVRGYESSTLRGTRAAMASVEYRFPLREIDRGPGTWPIFFHRILGDVFADAGTAWPRNRARQTIASVGAEVAIDLVLGYFAPLRYRAGVAYLLRDPGKGEVQPFITLESSF